jgi:hypothetical protein
VWDLESSGWTDSLDLAHGTLAADQTSNTDGTFLAQSSPPIPHDLRSSLERQSPHNFKRAAWREIALDGFQDTDSQTADSPL